MTGVGAPAGRRPSRIESLAADRPGALRLAVAGLALPVGLAALWLLLTSGQVNHPAVTAPATVLAAWSFVVAGLVAWTSRPENRTGLLMVLTGFLLLAGSLADTTAAVTFTVGVLLQPWADAVFAHLLLAFPQGRLHSRFERVPVITAYLDVTVGQFVMLLFMDSRIGSDCPCRRTCCSSTPTRRCTTS